MEFTIAIGLGGWALIVAGALLIGILAQFIGESHTGFEWIATTLGAAVGAVVASEFVTAWRTFEPVWDGLALVPAVAGALVVGGLVAVVTRFVTGESYSGRPMSA